jgi:hypoxanthine phosphoribosyltransferase
MDRVVNVYRGPIIVSSILWSLLSLQPPMLLLYTSSWSETETHIEIRSQVKRDYPLNLSILIRGGKENNHDTLSNGE